MAEQRRAPSGPPVPVLFAHYGDEGIRGSERVLLDLLRHLDRDRFAPTLWCNAETMASAAAALGVETRVVAMPILLGWDRPRFALGEHRRLRRDARAFIARRGIGVAHANSGAPNQWLLPAARAAGAGYVVHLHAHYGLRDRCTLLLHQAPMIVGCSEAVVAPFVEEGVSRQRVAVIPNGVDVERLREGDAAGLRRRLGIADDAVVVTAIGALVALKGYDVLIRAAAVLAQGDACPTFLLVGEGPEAKRLRALARELGVGDRIHFLGARTDVGAILRAATDILAAPSHTEAFGLTVAEAALMGVPAVASDIPGLRETVCDGGGLLVAAGSAEGFAQAIRELAANAGMRQAFGAAARAHAMEHFTIAASTRRFEGLYDTLGGATASFGGRSTWEPWRRLGMQWVRRRIRMPASVRVPFRAPARPIAELRL